MKYWLLTTEYPPFFGGGISTYCKFTAKMLVDRGFNVTIFVHDNSVYDVDVKIIDKCRVVRFNSQRSDASEFLGYVTNISYSFAKILEKYINIEGSPDVLEAQEYLGIAYYILQFKKLQYDWCKDIPVIITMHSPSFLYLEYNQVSTFKYPNYWIGEMERFCIQAADLLISPSQYLIDDVEKRFSITNPNLYLLPNPYDFQEVELQKDNDLTEIVFFGKLSVQKGTFKLLAYFKNLWDNGFMEPLVLIGGQDIVYHPEGKEMGDIVRSNYKNYISKGLLQLEDKIPPSEVKKRIGKAKVVIVPSIVDNLPYVVMEMMSLGLVVLVSKQGGQAEIVQDEVCGYIFDHDDPESFYIKLKKILSLTPEDRALMGNKAINRIKEYYNLQRIFDLKSSLINKMNSTSEGTINFPFIRQTVVSNTTVELKSDLLSIVVPYYNMGNYIDATMLSLENSVYGNKEIIIVNDGSNDPASLNKLNKYRSKQGVIVYDIENKGLGNARNFGAEMSKGSFLAFLDADDTVSPDYYTKAIKVLTTYNNVHFVGAWTKYFDGSNNVWPTFAPEPPIILYHNTINSSALVYKRESFLASGMNDTTMAFQGLEDYESVISMTNKGMNGVVLPEKLFNYRVRKNSMIRGISSSKKILLHQYISFKYRYLYSRFTFETLNLLNSNGPGIALDNPSLDYNLMDKLPFNNRYSKKAISILKRNKQAKKIAYLIYKIIAK